LYLAILIGLYFLRLVSRPRGARLLYWVVLIGLFLFSAFRFRVGCDWGGYYQNFILSLTYSYADAASVREPLWWIVLVALNRADLAYPWVNVLTSAIFFIGVNALARRQPDRLGFLVLLFPVLIINIPMSGIRQGAAMGLFCYAIIAFIDRRPLRFLGWTLLASTIHASAMTFAVLAPFATGRLTKARMALAATMAVPAILYISQRDDVTLAMSRYVGSDVEAFGAAFRIGLLTLTAVYFLLILRKPWKQRFPSDYGIVNMGSWMMLLITLALPFSSVIADRFGYYMIPLQTMMFARIPYLNLGATRKLQSVLPYLVLLLVFAVWSLNSSLFEACYNPYQSWLFGYPDGVSTLPLE
jgi:hypothetical protein